MTLFSDLVRESTTTTGTGTISLGGAYPGFHAFSESLSDGDLCYYEIDNFRSNGSHSEVGLGKYSANTLERLEVYSSTNNGSLVDFPVGPKDIRLTFSSSWLDKSGTSSRRLVKQTAHSLSVRQVVRVNASGEFVLAQANSEANSKFVGIVDEVLDANNFFISYGGIVSGFSGLSPNTIYYLSADTAGEITTVQPQINQKVLLAISATTGILYSSSYDDSLNLNNPTFTYDNDNNLTQINYGNGSIKVFTYDIGGNLVESEFTIGSKVTTKTFNYTNGLLTSINESISNL